VLLARTLLPGVVVVCMLGCCSRARMASSALCLIVCVCVQDKLAALTKFRESVSGATNREGCKAAARAVTVSKAAWLTACVSPTDPVAAKEYCFGLACVAYNAGVSGCDVIMAGCVPIIVECLRRWPVDGPGGVVHHACCALNNLAWKGSACVRAAIKSVPGIQATLIAAKESRLEDRNAALALEKLGL
jgi:hypothetical protein